MHAGIVFEPYQANLTAAGLSGRYSWSVTKGSLPPGLKLEAKDGRITGTPSRTGMFPLTLTVLDGAKRAAASKDLQILIFGPREDAYGGLADVSCRRGPQAHFYAERDGSRWHLCTPAGHAFWMNGIYHVDGSDSGKDDEGIVLSGLVDRKYRTGPTGNSTLNWALEAVRRMQSWGFNTLAEYANAWTLPVAVHSDWHTKDSTIPVKLPFVAFAAPSLYSMTNSGHYADGPVKDLIAGVKANVYRGYRSQSVDCWDPRFEQWFEKSIADDHWIQQSLTGPHKEYLIGFVVDDTDNLQGFGAGPDFPTVSNGVVAPGYDQVNLGWIVLVTAPEQ
ncbi:MAG TPA: Ig domain-containing protein, partial [Bryobacteraceae bacterium]|nr:Ig domain-containing protein [Bryobacteraceae bacterium]